MVSGWRCSASYSGQGVIVEKVVGKAARQGMLHIIVNQLMCCRAEVCSFIWL